MKTSSLSKKSLQKPPIAMRPRGVWICSVFAAALLALGGCASIGPITSVDKGPNEAIVIGRIRVFYNGEDVTKDSTIWFRSRGSSKDFAYQPDQHGTVYTKLPVGSYHVQRVEYRSFVGTFHHEFLEQRAPFAISDHVRVNYIGDLTLDWKGRSLKPSQALLMLGVVGGIASAIADIGNDGEIAIGTADNSVRALRAFNERFHTRMELASSPVRLTRQPPTGLEAR
jgi:hypothetical protein